LVPKVTVLGEMTPNNGHFAGSSSMSF